MHIANILKEMELSEISVVKNFLTTAADGKNYNVVFYSLEMIIAVGMRVLPIFLQMSSPLLVPCFSLATPLLLPCYEFGKNRVF